MKNELISVVIPIYNVEKYLNKCIDSIISQTYQNLEIILVNDGSPDECDKICNDYAKKDKRVVVINKENGGLSDARNAGIEVARGKYITFIDSDDYIELDFIEKLYNLIITHNADVGCCKFNIIYKEKKENKTDEIIEEFSNIEAIEEILYQRKIDNSACNKLYKTSLFNDIRYPKSKYFEDLDTTYKIFLKTQKIVSTNEQLYNYYQREGSILHKKNEKVCEDLYEIINMMEKNLNVYTSLNDAVKSRKINAYFYIYRNSTNKKLKNICKKFIYTERINVLKNKNISKKTKFGIYLSFIGLNFVNLFFKLLKILKLI